MFRSSGGFATLGNGLSCRDFRRRSSGELVLSERLALAFDHLCANIKALVAKVADTACKSPTSVFVECVYLRDFPAALEVAEYLLCLCFCFCFHIIGISDLL